jgi:hypothetical protein
MNSDGTGVVVATGGPNYLVHGGHRWFAQPRPIAGTTYPDGTTCAELFAVRDDGLAVQLTNDPTLEGRSNDGRSMWVPDGRRVAWVAKRWSNGAVVAGGIYVADLVFDAAGDITGLAAEPAAPAFPRPIVTPAGGGPAVPDVAQFSWSPDSARFAYVRYATATMTANSMDVADLAGADLVLVSQLGVQDAQWSPDGSKILYYEDRSRAWHTIAPDGGGDVKVIGSKPTNNAWNACWSPTGSYIAYAFQPDNYVSAYSVCRIAASGGAAVNLTPQFTRASPIGWTP